MDVRACFSGRHLGVHGKAQAIRPNLLQICGPDWSPAPIRGPSLEPSATEPSRRHPYRIGDRYETLHISLASMQ